MLTVDISKILGIIGECLASGMITALCILLLAKLKLFPMVAIFVKAPPNDPS